MRNPVESAQLQARVASLEAACELAKATLLTLRSVEMSENHKKWVEDALTILKAAIPSVKSEP